MFKESTFCNQNSIHNTNKLCKIQAWPCFCTNFFTMIFHIDSCQGVTQEAACLFLLLWSCLIVHVLGVVELLCIMSHHVFPLKFSKGMRKYHTPASNQRQLPLLVVKKMKMFLLALLSCTWPFVRWRVGAGSIFVVCPGCSLWIFSANGVHVTHTTRVHVKSCSFS